ncbi:hypothetical protein Tco_0032923 [Tanacetum coccineum]
MENIPLSVDTGKGLLFCLPVGKTGNVSFVLELWLTSREAGCVPTLDSISASLSDVDTLEVDAQEVESFDLGSEDLTLESLEAKLFVLNFEDLSVLSQETKSLDTELESQEVEEFVP